MTPEEYMESTAGTAKQFDEPQTLFPHDMDLLHASLGLVTEAAETADVFKRYLYYGKKVDVTNLKEEAGDLLWYLALMLRTIGSDFGEVMQMNHDKLAERYPEGFSKEKATNRNRANERKKMEAVATPGANGARMFKHPLTEVSMTARDWARKLNIYPKTFRDRFLQFGNIPEIYMERMPDNMKERQNAA